MSRPTADQIIAQLGLEPLGFEGGFIADEDDLHIVDQAGRDRAFHFRVGRMIRAHRIQNDSHRLSHSGVERRVGSSRRLR